MKNFTQLLALCAFVSFLFMPFGSYSQTGAFEARFNLDSYDEGTGYAYVDIEIKAQSVTQEFLITDQNYRFHFNSNVVPSVIPGIEPPSTNPIDMPVFISEELELSAIVFKDGTTSFFDAHTLTGTSGTLTSVNINYAGGDGTPVYASDWVKVNRLRLEIANDQDSLCLTWNQLGVSPETIVIEKVGNSFFQINEGIFHDICYYLPDEITFLPMELTTFTGKEQSCKVELEWETATEANTNFFIIERSVDGNRFEAIGTIEAAGTSNNAKQYTFTDLYANAENYYRLVQVDLDNSRSYSELIVVNTECFEEGNVQGAANVYPNPVLNGHVNFRVYHSGNAGEGKVSVTDPLGRLISDQTVMLQPGINKFETNLSRFPSGNYIYRFVDHQGYIVSRRFILQN